MDAQSAKPTITTYYNAASPGSTPALGADAPENEYDKLTHDLWSAVRGKLFESQAEVIVRNDTIANIDAYVYGNKLETSLDIPVGHDFTPVNWLKRVVEIHTVQFMGRPFQAISTYDVKDIDTAVMPSTFQQGQSPNLDKQRLVIENKKQKALAQLRMRTVKDIIRDNGGHSMFINGAESASVAGSFVIKRWYDEDEKK